jgi:hypothetical protein
MPSRRSIEEQLGPIEILGAGIYAQWGDRQRALDWLEKALRSRDSGPEIIRIDPLMDPLRNEPRFRAVVQALRFPD